MISSPETFRKKLIKESVGNKIIKLYIFERKYDVLSQEQQLVMNVNELGMQLVIVIIEISRIFRHICVNMTCTIANTVICTYGNLQSNSYSIN